MKNKSKVHSIVHLNEEDLPPSVREELQADPALRRDYESLRDTVSLIGLKRYERPPDEVMERMKTDIKRQIRLLEPEKAAPAWMGFPALRYGLIAVFAGLLGIQLLSLGRLPKADPIAWGADAPGARSPTLVAGNPATVSPSAPPLLPDTRWIYSTGSSNRVPGRIHYGGQPSALVEFDF